MTSFDFASFLDPPDTLLSRSTSEAIAWAELEGDRLYVANAHSDNLDASHGRNGYITAIDTTTHAIVWRSEGQVANGGSFVVTDDHVLCAYDDDELRRLFALDRETGATVAAIPLPVAAHALRVEGGRLKAGAVDRELTFQADRPAPIVRGPALRLTKVSEAKDLPLRRPSIFEERHVPRAEIDKPYPGHAGDLPDYVPLRLGTKVLFSARSTDSAKALVAVYGGATVLFDTSSRAPERRFDFLPLGAAVNFPQVARIEVEGNVVIAAGGATTPWLTAFDRASGAPYWTAAVAISDMILIDGWIVGAIPSRPGPGAAFTTELSVIDAATGAVRSRVTTVRVDRIVRQGDELVGGGPSSRAVFAITRE